MIVSEYKLPYTGAEVQEKLNAIGEGDVTAGTYGSYTSTSPSPYYYIPKITVNDQGIVTAASQSYLGTASTKSAGIMDSTMYSYVYNNTFSQAYSFTGAYKMTSSMSIGSIQKTSVLVNNAYTYLPQIQAAYAYIYVDEEATTRYWVPIDYYFVDGTSSTQYIATFFKIPEKYDAFNDTAATDVRYAVIYTRLYTVSSH